MAASESVNQLGANPNNAAENPSGESSAPPSAGGRLGGRSMLARHRAKEDADAEAMSRPQAPKGGMFPLGYRDGFSQWWASLAPAVTEHRVLSHIPYLQQPPTAAPPLAAAATGAIAALSERQPTITASATASINDPYGPRQWQSAMIPLSGRDRFLNEFSVERLGEETQNNLVMLHGYGAGLGFFYKNFEALSRRPNWKLYALDMLGMGRSSRPPFKIHAQDKEAKVREAENWFIDALEEWRQKKGIDKMTLLGHSMGGYLAVCYALKYPGHLNKIILASPVGFPEDPYAVNEALPEPGESTLASEFTQPADDVASSAPTKTPPRRPLPKWVSALWDANISPFSLVRLSGPLGPRLVSGWTSRRFSHLPEAEAQALHDYSYSLFRQRGSGEYALAYILAPGAFARSPLLRRIQDVGRQYISPATAPAATSATASATPVAAQLRERGIPIVFMYGSHDWMDIEGGYASEKKLKAEQRRVLAQATPEEREAENGDVKVVVIDKAGHHVYLDGCDQFNEVVLAELKDVERRQKLGKGL